MKKITFILLALISGTAFAQSNEAFDEASALAEIVEPLTIKNTRDLSFGRVVGAAGVVTIDATSAGLRSENSIAAPGGVTSSAEFAITSSDYFYSVTVDPTDLQHNVNTNEKMALTAVPSFTGNSGDQTLFVGGTLTVNANQEAGLYTGSVKVTVAYE